MHLFYKILYFANILSIIAATCLNRPGTTELSTEAYSTTMKEEPSCQYSNDDITFGLCSGKCDITGAQCKQLQRQDMIFCGCTYCIFDVNRGSCYGECEGEFRKCVPLVAGPKKNADCACDTCRTIKYDNGTIECAGSCFESGLKCQIREVPAFIPPRYLDYQCVCENPNLSPVIPTASMETTSIPFTTLQP